ncbi:hypothetical protein PS627_04535 [Pseudomonas fluorescens]|nr:hypothetical protein PS627_04535 [Pseudomonas fluorescens]
MLLLTAACPWYTSLDTLVLTVPELAPTAMVMLSPLASVTTTGVPVTGAVTLAVYRIEPPSATLGVAVRLTVDLSVTSVTLVFTVAGLATRFS